MNTNMLLLNEHTLVSTDFFFAVILSLGMGITWLLVFNAQLVAQAYTALEQPKVAKGDMLLEHRVKTLASGFPLARMAPYISAQPEDTAALLVGIAKKESNWGKRVPRKEGRDCYNYWGYRGKGEHVTWDGYTCFDSREQAVRMVGKRITALQVQHTLTTPREMVVWKCGWNCDGHNPVSVEKWIHDVEYYYRQVKKESHL